ncbi:MAG: DUF6702 family protein [Bradymonadia bacterium]
MKPFGALLHGALCTVVLCLWGLQSASAHPIYATLGEAEFNPESHSLEVALKVSVHDLEQAIGQRSGKVISIDAPGASAQVAAYLAETFVISEGSTPRPIKWVGLEAEITSAWLYFEVPLPQGVSGVTLAHRIFFEQAPLQLNTLNVKINGRLSTLVFTPEQPKSPLVGATRRGPRAKQKP